MWAPAISRRERGKGRREKAGASWAGVAELGRPTWGKIREGGGAALGQERRGREIEPRCPFPFSISFSFSQDSNDMVSNAFKFKYAYACRQSVPPYAQQIKQSIIQALSHSKFYF
jgi:hypothetical protein